MTWVSNTGGEEGEGAFASGRGFTELSTALNQQWKDYGLRRLPLAEKGSTLAALCAAPLPQPLEDAAGIKAARAETRLIPDVPMARETEKTGVI